MEFNTFDGIILSITIILAIKGFFSGLIKEISGLLGIVLGIYLGSVYYESAGKAINESIYKIPNESAINIVGFVAIFVLTWFLFFIFGLILTKIIEVAQLGILDRLGGVVFSAGKFFIIVAVFVTMLSKIEAMHKQVEKWSKDSITYPYLIKTGEFLMKIKPEDIKKETEKIKEKVNPNESDDDKNVNNKNVDKTIDNFKDKLNGSLDSVSKGLTKKIDETKDNLSKTIEDNLKQDNK